MLVKMLDAGLDIARLNFSHGDHETHGRSVANLREALKQRPGKSCAIMLDTKGPEIRTGMLKDH
jgi:pyruvate kinase